MVKTYSLADFIREEKRRRGLHTNREFANWLGLRNSTIDRILNGTVQRPTWETLEILSNKCNIDLEVLVALVSPELASRNRISPQARIRAQRFDQLDKRVQNFIDRLIEKGKITGQIDTFTDEVSENGRKRVD